MIVLVYTFIGTINEILLQGRLRRIFWTYAFGLWFYLERLSQCGSYLDHHGYCSYLKEQITKHGPKMASSDTEKCNGHYKSEKQIQELAKQKCKEGTKCCWKIRGKISDNSEWPSVFSSSKRLSSI